VDPAGAIHSPPVSGDISGRAREVFPLLPLFKILLFQHRIRCGLFIMLKCNLFFSFSNLGE
jgi:hypothetical protein